MKWFSEGVGRGRGRSTRGYDRVRRVERSRLFRRSGIFRRRLSFLGGFGGILGSRMIGGCVIGSMCDLMVRKIGWCAFVKHYIDFYPTFPAIAVAPRIRNCKNGTAGCRDMVNWENHRLVSVSSHRQLNNPSCPCFGDLGFVFTLNLKMQ